MRKHSLNALGALTLFMTMLITACGGKDSFDMNTRTRLFNNNWKFVNDSLPAGAEDPLADDASWRTVDLPHDWSIEALPGEENEGQTGPFSIKSPGNTSTGYVLGGTAWYRKHFTMEPADTSKKVFLKFDGVYMETTVWVNGHQAGTHTYGYTPFYVDITPYLNESGQENVVALRVSNTGRNSRWYSGSGIYRNVHLVVTDPLHIPEWGVFVTTPEIKPDQAKVNVSVSVKNDYPYSATAKVKISIKSPSLASAGVTEGELTLQAGEKAIFRGQVLIDNPALWSPASPDLYEAEVSIEKEGKTVDKYVQPFGVRNIEVSAEKGFVLNGVPIELKGGCMHHDNGLLGASAFERAEERRVQLMKNNGFNAIRTSHNPPSEAFLNACDRLGMLVIDETFDMWERPKNQQDYHRFFKQWWQHDVEAMISRDRNHPSIIMWSIGNEINERADTSGIRIARQLISFIKTMDTTRPFTNAICEFWDNPGTPWEATAGAFDPLTVGGYNYQYLRYESDHSQFPQRIMMGTESVPKDAFGNWQMVEKHPYVIGDFVWTGMDYLGETGIGHTRYLSADEQDVFAMPWPWFNAWCGDIDIMGDKKPQMLYRDVIWGNSKLEMNVHSPVPEGKTEKVSYWGWPDEYPSWNWSGNEGKVLQVSVYTSGDEVKLLLNDQEIGVRKVSPETKLTAVFDVAYQPGELKAVAYKQGEVIATKVLKTTGKPFSIKLTADRQEIRPDRNDLAYITIEITDETGQLVNDAALPVSITIGGDGELAGSGNACPYDMKSFGKTNITTYRGKAMVIVRPFAKKGEIIITALGQELEKGEVTVATR